MAPPEVVTTKPCPLVPAFKERPILFSAPMVRALLDGTKTQTRRVVKPPRGYRWLDLAAGTMVNTGGHKMHRSDLTAPYGQLGDRLWVRETWRHRGIGEDGRAERGGYVYRATENVDGSAERWIPSIHMLRAASRIDLEVTGVRVERLQDISEADARAEGARECDPVSGREVLLAGPSQRGSFVLHYRDIWEQINGAESWAANPWVWVVTFGRLVK